MGSIGIIDTTVYGPASPAALAVVSTTPVACVGRDRIVFSFSAADSAVIADVIAEVCQSSSAVDAEWSDAAGLGYTIRNSVINARLDRAAKLLVVAPMIGDTRIADAYIRVRFTVDAVAITNLTIIASQYNGELIAAVI